MHILEAVYLFLNEKKPGLCLLVDIKRFSDMQIPATGRTDTESLFGFNPGLTEDSI